MKKSVVIVSAIALLSVGFTAGYFVGTSELAPTATELTRSLEIQNGNVDLLTERLNSCSAKLKEYVEYVEAQK